MTETDSAPERPLGDELSDGSRQIDVVDDDPDEPTELDVPRETASIGTVERIENSADALEQLNRVIWQIAKAVWYTTLILLAIALLVVAYHFTVWVVSSL